jgi:hypothetical protein
MEVPVIRRILAILPIPFLILTMACSTTGRFKVPAGHKLEITDREVMPDALGQWKTSPFFWGTTDYRLKDSNGNVVRSGKVKTRFRVASIFWPPFAIIYWPMGLDGNNVYDFTVPGDGVYVSDNEGSSSMMKKSATKRK